MALAAAVAKKDTGTIKYSPTDMINLITSWLVG
jgi:hypothetical protein